MFFLNNFFKLLRRRTDADIIDLTIMSIGKIHGDFFFIYSYNSYYNLDTENRKIDYQQALNHFPVQVGSYQDKIY